MFYEIDALGEINWRRLENKFCTGYYDWQRMQFMPCDRRIDLTHTGYSSCKNCDDLTGSRSCVMCWGDVCRTKNAAVLQLCQSEHVLYLACFPQGKIKVGVTRYARRFERMLEQGAIYFLFVAVDNGKEIRKLEAASQNWALPHRSHKTVKSAICWTIQQNRKPVNAYLILGNTFAQH